MNRKAILALGILSLVIGSAVLILNIGSFEDLQEELPDPKNDSLETLDFEGPETEPKTIILQRGEYGIWTGEIENGIDRIDVTDREGVSVFEEDKSSTITIDMPEEDERVYEKLGDLNVTEEGSYTFQMDEGYKLYIMEKQSFFDIFGSIIAFIFLMSGSVGAVIGGLGLIIWVWIK